MPKFIICATDRVTNATIYARDKHGAIAFRTGVGIKGDPERALGLHLNRAIATPMAIEEAGEQLARFAAMQAIEGGSWVINPRIEVL